MSVRRWSATTTVLAAVAWLLWTTGPTPAELRAAVSDPQGLVDRAGADALLLVVVPVLAWVCWAWGALGLLLTAASTGPGAGGRLATALLLVVLPAGARRAAAVALGVGLGVAAPTVLLGTPPTTVVATAAAEEPGDSAGTVLVDWPATDEAAPDWPGVPDWPGSPGSSEAHVVLRGDCLWDIAAGWLARQAPGAPVPAADVQRAAAAWWSANAAVIGPDPDLLLPGQVLRPPG